MSKRDDERVIRRFLAHLHREAVRSLDRAFMGFVYLEERRGVEGMGSSPGGVRIPGCMVTVAGSTPAHAVNGRQPGRRSSKSTTKRRTR